MNKISISYPNTIVTNTLPSTWDWRNINEEDWTTPIKEQNFPNRYPSCWAFATLGAIEIAINIEKDLADFDLDLSEQYLLSCSDVPTPTGSGNPLESLDWIQENGVLPESCFPYQADCDIPCGNKCSNW
jgi:hypothetical protein